MYFPEHDGDWRLVRPLGLMMVVMTEYTGDQYHWTTSSLAFSFSAGTKPNYEPLKLERLYCCLLKLVHLMPCHATRQGFCALQSSSCHSSALPCEVPHSHRTCSLECALAFTTLRATIVWHVHVHVRYVVETAHGTPDVVNNKKMICTVRGPYLAL